MADQLKDVRRPEFSDFISTDGKLLDLDHLKNESMIDRQSRRMHLQRMMEDQSRAFREISQRGFETPKLEPTKIPGVTFSKMVDPTDPASLVGEAIRQRIAKGVSTENEVRAVGSRVRQSMETDELKRLVSKGNRTKAEIQKLYLKEVKGKLSANDRQKLADLRKEIDQHLETIQRIKQDRFLSVMSQIRDFGSGTVQPLAIGSDPSMSRLYVETSRFFPKDWLDKFHATPLMVGISPRNGVSYYVHQTRELRISPSGQPVSGLSRMVRSTMAHEMFHQAENTVPGVYQAQKELYQRRTKGNQVRLLSWNKQVKIKRNSWLGSKKNGQDEYMGREYSDGYEIGTMGLQGILFGDVSVEEDEEVYDLVLGMLASF
jgi:hypothetical protein